MSTPATTASELAASHAARPTEGGPVRSPGEFQRPTLLSSWDTVEVDEQQESFALWLPTVSKVIIGKYHQSLTTTFPLAPAESTRVRSH